jgi:hypothetical protein
MTSEEIKQEYQNVNHDYCECAYETSPSGFSCLTVLCDYCK